MSFWSSFQMYVKAVESIPRAEDFSITFDFFILPVVIIGRGEGVIAGVVPPAANIGFNKVISRCSTSCRSWSSLWQRSTSSAKWDCPWGGGGRSKDRLQQMDYIIIVIQGFIIIQPSEHLLSGSGVGIELRSQYGRTQTARRHPRESIIKSYLGS